MNIAKMRLRYIRWISLFGLLCATVFFSWPLHRERLTTMPSHGFVVNLLRRGPNPDVGVTDGDGLYTLVIQPNQMARIRYEQIPLEQLGRRLQMVFRMRSEHLLLVAVEGQVTFGEVMSFLDVASSVEHFDFALLTPNSAPTRQQPSLFMKGEAIYTQYFPL